MQASQTEEMKRLLEEKAENIHVIKKEFEEEKKNIFEEHNSQLESLSKSHQEELALIINETKKGTFFFCVCVCIILNTQQNQLDRLDMLSRIEERDSVIKRMNDDISNISSQLLNLSQYTTTKGNKYNHKI